MADPAEPPPAELPPEYLEGVRLFNAGEYYDAHESWEERWLGMGDSAANFYKGLIQAAVALLHWERGNFAGARKLSRSARRYLSAFGPRHLCLDVDEFVAHMDACFAPLYDAFERQQPAPPFDPGRAPRIRLNGTDGGA